MLIVRICYTAVVKFLSKQNIAGSVLLLSVFALLLVGTFGLGHSGIMEADGQMSNCPLPGMATACKMGLLEHIAAWQNMFVASLHKDIPLLLVLLLLAMLLAFSAANLSRPKRKPLSIYAHSLRARSRIDIPIIIGPLQEAFSNGILNPKIF